MGRGSRLKAAAGRIARPAERHSRNQNGRAARSADKNVGVAGLEGRSTGAVKSSRAAKNSKGCNPERRSRNQTIEGCVMANCCQFFRRQDTGEGVLARWTERRGGFAGEKKTAAFWGSAAAKGLRGEKPLSV